MTDTSGAGVPERLFWNVMDTATGIQPVTYNFVTTTEPTTGDDAIRSVEYVTLAHAEARVREALERAENVACALDMQGLRLHCGEMTAEEARAARAAIGFIKRGIRALAQPTEGRE